MGPASPRPEDRPLDGELRMAGRVGAIAAGVGCVAGIVIWVVRPELAGPPLAAGLGIAVAATMPVACVLLPWDRLSQRWVLFPIVGGILLTALASANAQGIDSPFSAFFVFLAAMAGYFCTREQALAVLALIVVASG